MIAKGRPSRLLIASAMFFTSAAIAAAQTAMAPPAPATAGWGHDRDHRQGPQDWRAERSKMEERRLAELHAKLNLKPGQEPGWQAFVTGLHAARPMPEPQDHPDWETMKMETAPQKLDRMLARIDKMRAHLAQMDHVVNVFYAGLSKDQQTIFDDNFRFIRHHGGGSAGWGRQGRDPGHMDHGHMGQGGMGPPGMGTRGMGRSDIGPPTGPAPTASSPQM